MPGGKSSEACCTEVGESARLCLGLILVLISLIGPGLWPISSHPYLLNGRRVCLTGKGLVCITAVDQLQVVGAVLNGQCVNFAGNGHPR